MVSSVQRRGGARRLAAHAAVSCATAIFLLGVDAGRSPGMSRTTSTALTTSTARTVSGADVWLQSVACASPQACTAVGVFDANRLALSLGNGVPAAERWNGRHWSLQRMP